MENLVSPLMSTQQAASLPLKPLWDDPYAFVQEISSLTYHEFHFIFKKIDMNWITERDVELVKFIYVHRWLTLNQITRLFFSDVTRENSVRNRLNRLIKYGIVRRVRWTSYIRPITNRPCFYELGASGADILKYKYGMALGKRDPRTAKPATMIFRMKYVATNELYIQLRESFDLVHFEFHPLLILDEERVVPTARYILRTPNGREMPFYLFCYREEEKWMKTIRYQARFLKQYTNKVEQGLVFVVLVSTDERAFLASQIMEQEGVGTHVLYVTDKDLTSSNISLKQGFFSFQNGEKMYYDLG